MLSLIRVVFNLAIFTSKVSSESSGLFNTSLTSVEEESEVVDLEAIARKKIKKREKVSFLDFRSLSTRYEAMKFKAKY